MKLFHNYKDQRREKESKTPLNAAALDQFWVNCKYVRQTPKELASFMLTLTIPRRKICSVLVKGKNQTNKPTKPKRRVFCHLGQVGLIVKTLSTAPCLLMLCARCVSVCILSHNVFISCIY